MQIRQAQAFEPARKPVEQKLTALWSELLGVERVGIHDNFFELGGDSIVSIQLVSRARREGIWITVNQLFRYPNIAELAGVAALRKSWRRQGKVWVGGDVPLTAIQRWFFEQKFVHPDHSNQAVFLEIRQPLDGALVMAAVPRSGEHHDALRLRFIRTEAGGARCTAHSTNRLPFETGTSRRPYAELSPFDRDRSRHDPETARHRAGANLPSDALRARPGEATTAAFRHPSSCG